MLIPSRSTERSIKPPRPFFEPQEIHSLFCEVVIAPSFSDEALEILKGKKNRIILIQKETKLPENQVRTCLNGVLVQGKDNKTDVLDDLSYATTNKPTEQEIEDLLFASKICKHTKSNTIVLAKNKQLCSSGTGQTSRVDALRQSIEKAGSFKFDLKGAVMASDAFFPFPDCVEIAGNAGITAVIQPGGSIKDRPVKYILDDAIKNGLVHTNDTIIEATSGNTGVSLAMMCAERGFKCIIVMPSNMSDERKQLIGSLVPVSCHKVFLSNTLSPVQILPPPSAVPLGSLCLPLAALGPVL